MSLTQSSHSVSLTVTSDIPFPTAQDSSTSRPAHRTKPLQFPSMPPLHFLHISRPKIMRRHTEPAKLKHKCSSGPSKQTHPTLVTCTNQRRGIIEQRDTYVCLDAVNAPRLVALTRAAMDAQVQCWGGNALVDESWSYTVQQRKSVKSNHGSCFKVSVIYTGVVARCDRPDPHYPVALEEAKGIPGLMTVISRE